MAGEIQLNGVELATESGGTVTVNNSVKLPGTIKSLTAINLNSSTHDFTIPSGAKYVTLAAIDISTTNSSVDVHIQLGNSGGIVNSGYTGVGGYYGSTTSIESFTSGFMIFNGTANTTVQDAVWELWNLTGDNWMCKGLGNYGTNAPTLLASSSGHVDLSGGLTTVRITCTSGSFDGGTANVLYMLGS